jgi:transcriptional regulator with XRE-family HTH domain
MKRPQTRVEEIRVARGITKAELARRAEMPPQTLQRIEDGSTKTLSFAAREKLTRALRVRDDQLLAPIGTPFDTVPGEQAPINTMIYLTCVAILAELRTMNKTLELLARPGGDGAGEE